MQHLIIRAPIQFFYILLTILLISEPWSVKVGRCILGNAHYCFIEWNWSVKAEADGGQEDGDIAKSPRTSSSSDSPRPTDLPQVAGQLVLLLVVLC